MCPTVPGSCHLLAEATTTTTLSSSPTPSTSGQAVKFVAVVTSKLGAPLDGETVSFKEASPHRTKCA